MTYEERNTHAYNEFMYRLGMKMLERYEAQQAFLKEQADRYNRIMSQYNNQVQASGINLPLPPIIRPAKNSISRTTHSHRIWNVDLGAYSDFVTADELEVIRAYKDGGDVLSTIMSQER